MITSALILFMILTVSLPLTVSAADVNTDMDIRVFIDGEEIEFDVKPAVIDQRTMVPMRFIFEYFGLDVEWNQNDQSITVRLGDSPYLRMQLNSKIMQTYNDDGVTKKWMDVAPCAINGRTLVPLRAIAEIFGADVAWEQETTSVIITTPYPKNLDQSLPEQVPYEYEQFSYTYTNPTSPSEYVTISFNDNIMNVSGIMADDYRLISLSILDGFYYIHDIVKNEEFSADFQLVYSDIWKSNSIEIWGAFGGYGDKIVPLELLANIPIKTNNEGLNEFPQTSYVYTRNQDVSLELSFDGTIMKVSGILSKDHIDASNLSYMCNGRHYDGIKWYPLRQGESISMEVDLNDILNPSFAYVCVDRVSYDNTLGSFTSVEIDITNGLQCVSVKAPVALMHIYDNNYEFMSNWVAPSIYLKNIMDQELVDLSNMICKDAIDDYDKVLRIHDWVCENIYYDYDYFRTNTTETAPIDVLYSKKTICDGYAKLIQALVQAQNIPCRYILGDITYTGWTLQNITHGLPHAWNQAYIDNHWITIDATWDCLNSFENGEYQAGEIRHTYFDISLFHISADHKFLD